MRPFVSFDYSEDVAPHVRMVSLVVLDALLT